MALYDLRCQDCKKEYTKMVPFSKLSEIKCPVCGSENHERIYKANIKGPISGSSTMSTPATRGFT